MRRSRGGVLGCGLLLPLLVARHAAADEGRLARADLPARLADPDTADGRIDGDLGLVVGVGTTLRGDAPRGVADLRLRYLDTAGAFVTYEDGFGANAPGPERLVAVGFELRPLFLARWVTGRELGVVWPDLVIDSLGLELGAFFEQPGQASFDARPGMQASVGLELPLLARATGPWIGVRLGGRWSGAFLSGGTEVVACCSAPLPGQSEGFLSITLAWHQLFATHVVDLSDTAP